MQLPFHLLVIQITGYKNIFHGISIASLVYSFLKRDYACIMILVVSYGSLLLNSWTLEKVAHQWYWLYIQSPWEECAGVPLGTPTRTSPDDFIWRTGIRHAHRVADWGNYYNFLQREGKKQTYTIWQNLHKLRSNTGLQQVNYANVKYC